MSSPGLHVVVLPLIAEHLVISVAVLVATSPFSEPHAHCSRTTSHLASLTLTVSSSQCSVPRRSLSRGCRLLCWWMDGRRCTPLKQGGHGRRRMPPFIWAGTRSPKERAQWLPPPTPEDGLATTCSPVGRRLRSPPPSALIDGRAAPSLSPSPHVSFSPTHCKLLNLRSLLSSSTSR